MYYVVDEKIDINDRTYISKFVLTSLKSLFNRLTLFAASHTSNTSLAIFV